MRSSLIACVCLSGLMWAQSNVAPAEQLVFNNVNVIDTRYGDVLHNRTVVVGGGKIVSVAKIGLIATGRNVRMINATGKYLIPGLWDMHVHTGGPDAWDERIIYPLYIADGVTGVRDMSGDPELLVKRRGRIASGEIVGPQLLIGGPFADNALTSSAATAEAARQKVQSSAKQGADFIEVSAGLSRESFLATTNEAARNKYRVAGQVPPSVSVAEASTSGQRSIEHMAGVLLACSSQEKELRDRELQAMAEHDAGALRATRLQAMSTYDSKKAWDLFVGMANNNTWQVPALVWSQARAMMANGNAEYSPELRYVPVSMRQQWEPGQVKQRTTADEASYIKKEAERDMGLADAMRRAGLQFMAGTSSPDAGLLPGASLHDELELMVKCGFTPLQALQAATFNPALFMVKLDKYGVVEKGHFADLVLLDANPLEDIRNTRKIAAVVLRGKYYSREDLHRMLAGVAALAGQPSGRGKVGRNE